MNKKNGVTENEAIKDVEKAVSETLIFQSKLVKGGTVTFDRKQLVASIQNEHRSYANDPLIINDRSSFSLPELKEQYPLGFKVGVVIYLPDNAKGDKKKGQLDL
jgi:hypothetical protein